MDDIDDYESDSDFNFILQQHQNSLLEDLDLAFELQLQEALIASTQSSQQSIEDVRRKFQQTVYITDDDDDDDHVDFERLALFGESSSSSSIHVHRELAPSSHVNRELVQGLAPYRLYFKGLFNEPSSGIGVAICDYRDNIVKKIQKPLNGKEFGSYREVELIGLIEGLEAAVELGIKRINLFCVNRTIFQQITGRWQVKQRRIATLINQVFRLQKKFETCRPLLVPGNDLKYVFQLARDAIDSQITKVVVDSSGTKNKIQKESCTICLEDTDSKEMFIIDGCSHRYCFSCMKQHMEVKILQGVIPGCPHQECKTTLTVDGTKRFLPPKLVERMSLLIKEAAVPVTEKVYCPYPKCSTLMSRREAHEYTNKFMAADRTVVRKCVNCHGLFCIDCKVPWHSTMNCNEFKRSNISARVEEAKLKTLANQNLWRQCVKCGYQFCYTCGAEWKNKKQTCRCKLWDERNIMHDYDEDEDDDDYFDEEDDYDEYYDDFDHEEEDFVRDVRGWH
ncbi:hypothetical protein ACHQM5_021800 [Ranunculus cassubicifolius]